MVIHGDDCRFGGDGRLRQTGSRYRHLHHLVAGRGIAVNLCRVMGPGRAEEEVLAFWTTEHHRIGVGLNLDAVVIADRRRWPQW